jgi:hypothetical protein
MAVPRPEALNTGILCDGLRAVDFDIDNPTLLHACRAVFLDLGGEAPMRWRHNSPRCLLVYRAAEGEPGKITLAGRLGKIEVLGRGQQFVAHGVHDTGADLEWMPEAPWQVLLSSLPALTEDQVHAALARCAPIIGATVGPRRANGADHTYGGERPQPGRPQCDPFELAADLRDIPNDGPPNWDMWSDVALGIWAATGGLDIGWVLLDAWSRRHGNYDPVETRNKWDHIFRSPPDHTGYLKFKRMAREARERANRPAPGEGLSFTTFADARAAADIEDFVEDLLIMGAMSVLYGPPNCGKSFFVLDLAVHVTAAPEWRGKAVDRGAVIYIPLEGGAAGINNRIVAIKQREGWDGYDLPLAVIGCSVDLRHADAHVQPLIDTVATVAARFVAAECPVRWIIVDTLSRALAGGAENTSEDMGALVMNCDAIRRATGCHLTLVHHSGKDETKGARGHTVLLGATDTEIEVFDQDGTRTVTVTKQRDLPLVGAFAFRLRQVEIGTNRRGKPITSCVVEYEGEPTPRADRRRGRGEPTHADRALEILADLCARQGATGYADVPPGYASVPAAWWRERFYQRAMPGDEPDTKKHAFARAAKILIGSHRVGMAGERVWHVDGGKSQS